MPRARQTRSLPPRRQGAARGVVAAVVTAGISAGVGLLVGLAPAMAAPQPHGAPTAVVLPLTSAPAATPGATQDPARQDTARQDPGQADTGQADTEQPEGLLPDNGRPTDPLLGERPAADAGGAQEPQVVDAEPGTPPRSSAALVGGGALVAASLVLLLIGLTTVAWTLHAWRTPESLAATRFSGRPATSRPRVTLLVPGRHEEAVLGETLDTLARSRWDDLEILAIVGHDDPGTHAVAAAAAQRHPGLVRVVVDHHKVKNKPKAMNTALPEVTGQIVGVFDAEDDVAPDLIPNIVARFEETGADVVQGGVQLMNYRDSWFAMRNVLEYYFWFRSRLHFHAGVRFIPLGGNTVFFRTDVLREHGGWDAECLAEDCEIGVRLSVAGKTVAVAYDVDLVTREETPDTLGALIKQRTRWNQGFLQVLGRGHWRRLPGAGQRALALYTLVMPFLQSFAGIMIPISIGLILFAQVPTWVALLSFTPLVPALVTLVVEVVGLAEFGRAYGPRARFVDYARLVLGTVPYQVVLAVSAVRATVRHLRGDGSWEKTAHTGLHRSPVVTVPETVVDLRDDRQPVRA